jgi:hypothetical protein
MRAMSSVCFVVLVSLPAISAAQGPKKTGKGKATITVTGCVEGGWLRVREVDPSGSYTERYRLHGSKQLLKEMSSKHNNHVLEVTGTVTDVGGNTHAGQTVQVGKKTRVYVGTKEVPQVPSGQEDAILDVLSYVEQDHSCKG